MAQDERPFKGISDAVTGEMITVPVDDAEWDEIKAKKRRVQAELEAQAAIEASTKAEAEADKVILDARPTDDDIWNAKDIEALKEQMLKQNAVIVVLLKKQGLTE